MKESEREREREQRARPAPRCPACARARVEPHMTRQSSLLPLLDPPAGLDEDAVELEDAAAGVALVVLVLVLDAAVVDEDAGFFRLYLSRSWSCLDCISLRRLSAFSLRRAASSAWALASASCSFLRRCCRTGTQAQTYVALTRRSACQRHPMRAPM